jgi:hypothetical protein
MVLKNQVAIGTVNADRNAFENAISEVAKLKREQPDTRATAEIYNRFLQIAVNPPFVLREERILLDIGVRGRTGRTGTLERLDVARGLVLGERSQGRERVRAEEIAGEVVQDVVELEIEPALHLVRAAGPGDGIRHGDITGTGERACRIDDDIVGSERRLQRGDIQVRGQSGADERRPDQDPPACAIDVMQSLNRDG